jgi:hypothetical protein
VAKVERRELAGAGEEPGRAHQRHRSHPTEERAAADRDRLGLARHPHVADLIIGRNALDQGRYPVVGQRGGELDPAFRQLTVNPRVHVHGRSAQAMQSIAPGLTVPPR